MKKLLNTVSSTAGLSLIGLALLGAASAGAETKMRAVSFIPKTHPVMIQAIAWTDKVNAGLKGTLNINYVGGSEVIERFQQAEAVRNGVIDLVYTVTADYQAHMPSGQSMVLSRLSPSEERKSGYYDWLVKRHMEKLNARYLGRLHSSGFYLWANKKAEKLSDLKGLKMRTGSLYDRFMRALGKVPVTMNSPEVHTALERGVVDGFGWPNMGPRQRGWIKKAKYVIDLPFFGASNVVALMNLDKWKGLSKATQDKIVAISAGYEPSMVAHFKSGAAAEWKKLDAAGVVRYKFSDAVNKQYLNMAYDLEWKNLAKKVPNDVATLRRITGN